eukprot:752837-Hanusia_phi.AAC.1
MAGMDYEKPRGTRGPEVYGGVLLSFFMCLWYQNYEVPVPMTTPGTEFQTIRLSRSGILVRGGGRFYIRAGCKKKL